MSRRHIIAIEPPKDVSLEDARVSSVFLPHPKHVKKMGCRYLLVKQPAAGEGTEEKAHLLELQENYAEPSSWFVGDSVEAKGALHVATRVDPLFLALPYLWKARRRDAEKEGYFVEPKTIFKDPEYPAVTCLGPLLSEAQLGLICDDKEGWNSRTFRLNDEKLAKWMQAKVTRLCSSLSTHTQFQLIGSDSDDAAAQSKEARRHAIGFISEYLTPDALELLLKSYGLGKSDMNREKKAKNYAMGDLTTADADTSSNHKRKAPKQAVDKSASMAQKKLAKIDTKGMNSLASFFGGGAKKAKPKPKKK